MGCCVCSSVPKCDNATALGCDSQQRNDPTCFFVLGGRCQLEGCIGGTRTASPTATRTPTSTGSVTVTPTGTSTSTQQSQSTSTATHGPSLATPTDTPAATFTGEPTDTPTASNTASATVMSQPSDTPTESSTPSATVMNQPTDTPTASSTPSATAIAAQTPSATGSESPSPTPTASPTPRCKTTPLPGCLEPSPANRWILALRKIGGRKQRLVWKWRGGPAAMEDFGDPLTSTDYTLCIYTGAPPTRVMEVTAPGDGTCSGRPCWKARGNGNRVRRYSYVDHDHSSDGLARVVLRTRPSIARANLVVIGRGPNLPMPDLPLDEPVLAQLVRSDAAICWQGRYEPPALRNTDKEFRDKSD